MSGLKLSRYDQHIELREVKVEGQRKIYASRVLVVGAGGLGCPVSLYLTGAGVGTVGIIDGDRVESTNLPRQILYKESDIGSLKSEIAKDRLTEIACNQTIKHYPFFLSEENAADIIKDYDLVVDATDEHKARLLINKVCLALDKPWVYGALYRFEGQTAIFNGRRGACFTCLFPGVNSGSALPTCKTSGVLSPVPGIVGSMQALDAMKIILGLYRPEDTRLNISNFLCGEQTQIVVPKNPECPACKQYL